MDDVQEGGFPNAIEPMELLPGEVQCSELDGDRPYEYSHYHYHHYSSHKRDTLLVTAFLPVHDTRLHDVVDALLPTPATQSQGDYEALKPNRREPKFSQLNVTAYSSAKQYIEASDRDLYFIQEPRVSESDAVSFCHDMLGKGMKVALTPSRTTEAGGLSAGAMLLAKSTALLADDPDHPAEIFPHHAVGGIARVHSSPPMLAVSAYFVHGLGMKGTNLEIVKAITQRLRRRPLPFIIGADFNMPPDQLLQSNWINRIDAVILWSGASRPTYQSGEATSTIDYYIVDRRLLSMVKSLNIDGWATIAKHKPVCLTFASLIARTKCAKIKARKLLPDLVFGPTAEPTDISLSTATAAAKLKQKLVDEAEVGDGVIEVQSGEARVRYMDELNDVYTQTMAALEKQILTLTDSHDTRAHGRGLQHKYATVPVLPAPRFAMYFQSHARALAWLEDLCIRLRTFMVKLDAQRQGHADGCRRPQVVATIENICRDIWRAHNSWKSPFAYVDEAEWESSYEIRSRALALAQRARRICSRGPSRTLTSPRNFDFWLFVANILVADLHSSAKIADAAEVRTREEGWKRWISIQYDPAGRRAHQWSKAQESWQLPKAQVKHQRLVVPDEQTTADSEADKWGTLWDEATTAPHYAPTPHLPTRLPRPSNITGMEVQNAGLSFKKWTSNPDGIHPRHLGHATPRTAGTIANIMMCVEALGDMPPCKQQMECALLTKPSGGLRTIGLYDGLMRVLQRLRKPALVRWQTMHDRPYWATDAGRGAQRVIWRQSVRAEIATLFQRHSAGLFWDLWKCYDTANHDILWREAVRLGFPLTILALSLSSYKWKRRLDFNGCFSRAIWPTKGIIAGSTSATYELKTLLLAIFDHHSRLHPTIALEVFVDDIGQTAEADTMVRCENTIVASAVDLAQALEDGKFSISADKGVTMANSAALAHDICFRLGKLGGKCASSFRNLGIDYSHGRGLRVARKAKVTKLRWTAAALRARKLAAIRRACKATARRVIHCGVMPSVGFASPCIGMSKGETRNARRVIGQAHGIFGKGKCSELGFLVLGDKLDPGIKFGYAAVRMLLEEIWLTCVGAKLRKSYTIPAAQLHGGVNAAIKAGNRDAGPLSLAVALVGEAGLSWTLPFQWALPSGEIVRLAQSPPNLTYQHLLRAHELTTSIDALRKLRNDTTAAEIDALIADHLPLHVLHIRQAMRSTKLTALERALLLSLYCGGVWTAARRERYGLTADPCCKHCGELDTLYHRLWLCAATAELRVNVPAWILERAAAAGPSSLRYSRLLARNPSRHIGAPTTNPTVVWRSHNDDASTILQGVQPDRMLGLDELVATDGSAIRVGTAQARATWSVVVGDSDGSPCWSLSGTVPPNMPQNASFAEHYGYIAAMQYLIPQTGVFNQRNVLVCDNQGVVNCAGEGLISNALKPATYAGIWRSTFNDSVKRPDQPMLLFDVAKIKSHLKLDDIPFDEPIKRKYVRLNAAADHWAGEAHSLFGDDSDKLKAAAVEQAELKVLAIHAARCLALWVEPGHDFSNKFSFNFEGAPRRKVVKPVHSSHELIFDFDKKLYVCRNCKRIMAAGAASSAATSLCIGVTPAIKRVVINRDVTNHDLWWSKSADGPILFCNKCHGYADKRSEKLAKACTHAPARGSADRSDTSFGRTAAARLKRGQHPVTKLPVSRLERLTRAAADWISSAAVATASSDSLSQCHPLDVHGDPAGPFVEPALPHDPTVDIENVILEAEPDPFGWGLELE